MTSRGDQLRELLVKQPDETDGDVTDRVGEYIFGWGWQFSEVEQIMKFNTLVTMLITEPNEGGTG